MIKNIKWNQFPRAALDALYPRRCPVCGEIVTPKGRLICPSCLLRLSPVKSPVCQKCGKEVWSEEIEYCPDCVKHRRSFARGMALFNYTEEAARSMAAVKYKNKREYLDFYAEAAAEKLRQYENREEWQFDGLVPVPVHPARKRKRGFNQAEVLAKRIGERLEMPVYPEFLYRIRNTEPLKELNPDERQVVCKTCFSWMIFIRPEARRKRVPGRFCLRGSKKSVFLPFVLDKDAKVGYDREDRQREAL